MKSIPESIQSTGSTLPHTPQDAHVDEGYCNLALASQAKTMLSCNQKVMM